MRKRHLTKRFLALLMAVMLTAGNAGITVHAEEAAVQEAAVENEAADDVTEEATETETDAVEETEEQETDAAKETAEAETETAEETTEIETVEETVEEENETTGETTDNGISQIVLTVGAEESEVNVTWYTTTPGTNRLQYAKIDEEGAALDEMPENYEQCNAKTTASSYEGYYTNSVTLKGLEADAAYVYRVSGKEEDGTVTWSHIYKYTVQNTAEGYEFLVVGDPQIGSSNTETDSENWASTMETATDAYPNASFLLSVGDQINSARNNDTKAEENFTGFLAEEAGLVSLPIATSVGNHDNSHSGLYTSHFTLPNVSSYGSTNGEVTGEEDYYFTYGNTLFMMLNTNNSSIAEHKAFMENAIAANDDCTWRVVAFHQSIYSVASHVNDGNIAELRVGLSPVFASNDIDVVLMGHDHVYARSYIMGGVNGMQAEVTETVQSEISNPDGVQYITFNSGSGSKYYNITQELYEYTAVQNQEKVPNYSHVTVTEDSFTVTTYRTTDNSVVDTVTIYKTDDKEDILTDTVKIVDTTKTTTAETQTEGYENGEAEISITKTAEYDSGVENPDGGSAEIVQYNSDTQMYYVVNGTTGTLDIVPREGYEVNGATGVKCDIKSELAELRPDFTYGDMTSVAVSTETDLIAIAVQAEGTAEEGLIVLMNYDNEVVAVVGAGVQPDMVTFTPDGTKVLSANEGEPRDGYAAESDSSSANNGQQGGMPGGPGMGGNSQQSVTDPAGTVTILDLSAGIGNITTQEVTFEAFDSEEARAALVEAGVIIKSETNPSVDFEPEYIAVSADGKTAYVSLQEANAIATIDIENAAVTAVNSLGFKNHNLEKNALDLAADGEIKLETANVYGIYMPDGISLYEVDGKTYLVTANEGDSREWGEEDTEEYHCNEAKTKEINGTKVTIFDASEYDGLDEDKTYIFGGRSFAIYEMNGDGTMTQVYESGSDFETILSGIEELTPYFNCSNDDEELDSRSGKKGPEAESVTIGEVNGRTYAFIGLERISGVMVYDITDPENAFYVNYINSRSFGTDEDGIDGDDSPEGMVFVPAEESVSGNAELIVAHEVSGTVAVYEVTVKEEAEEDDKTDDEGQDDVSDGTEDDAEGTGSETEDGSTGTGTDDSTSETNDNSSVKDETSTTVDTGDSQNVFLYVGIGFLSVFVAVAVLIRRKENEILNS